MRKKTTENHGKGVSVIDTPLTPDESVEYALRTYDRKYEELTTNAHRRAVLEAALTLRVPVITIEKALAVREAREGQ